MASSALKNVIAKAHQVFKLKTNPAPLSADPNHIEKFSSELQSLSEAVSTLNADNINLHEIVESIPSHHRQPITFIHICENPVMCAVIIVMKPGGSGIPLHDHPGMYGLIKVLHGHLRVRTYTAIRDMNQSPKVPAVRNPDMVLSNISDTQILSPVSRNIHQIEYVSGEGGKEYAAFLDILSPPYQDDVGCHYYKTDESESDYRKLHKDVTNLSKCNLLETDCPKDYCTSSVYL